MHSAESLRGYVFGSSLEAILSCILRPPQFSVSTGEVGIEPTNVNSCFIFLPNKDAVSFHFDNLKQKLNHLKVREVVDTIQGVPSLQA